LSERVKARSWALYKPHFTQINHFAPKLSSTFPGCIFLGAIMRTSILIAGLVCLVLATIAYARPEGGANAHGGDRGIGFSGSLVAEDHGAAGEASLSASSGGERAGGAVAGKTAGAPPAGKGVATGSGKGVGGSGKGVGGSGKGVATGSGKGVGGSGKGVGGSGKGVGGAAAGKGVGGAAGKGVGGAAAGKGVGGTAGKGVATGAGKGVVSG